MSAPTLLLAGGGTGGHVFPLLAVADALRDARPELRLVFVGTARGMETRVVPERGYALELLEVLPLRGGGWSGAARGALRAAATLPAALGLLRRYEPRAVLSIGGYAAGPLSLAARLARTPLALVEPNGSIGLANRLIAPWVQRAYTAFPEAERHFPRGRVVASGVPLRRGFEAAPFVARGSGALRVLVLGGSQGARSLNEVVPVALARAQTPVRVLHQAGRGGEEEVRRLYDSLGASGRASVVPFIDEMPAAIAHAHLVIGRAGASAVAEICAVGRPSLLLPYPYAGDHQKHNALSLERQGAARSVLGPDVSAERLAREVDDLAAQPATLVQMAERARALGRPQAAQVIARDLLELAGLTPRIGASGLQPSVAEPPRVRASRGGC